MINNKKNTVISFGFGITGVIIFSGTLPATKLAINGFQPWFLTTARATIATIAAICVVAATKKIIKKQFFVQCFVVGMLLVYGFPGFMALAMKTVPAAHGGVILGILPLATAIFATIIAKEKPSWQFWVCGIIGSALVVTYAIQDGGGQIVKGDVWLLAAGICAAAGYTIAAKLTKNMQGWEVISWALILTSPITFVTTAALWEPQYQYVRGTPITALIYLGLGSMYLGFFAWNKGLQMGGIAKIGQLQLFQIFFTIAISAVVAGETITTRTALFAVAVFVVVLIAHQTRVKRS